MRLIPLFVFLLLALGLTLALLHQAKPRSAVNPEATPLPAVTLTTLDGKQNWSAAALQNHVTVLNFFASWCTPCALEMPELEALKKQFPDLRMEGIAWNDQPEAMKKFLQNNGNPYDTIWYDENGKATIGLGIKGIPETIIIDGKGMVRYRLAGPLTAELREGEVAVLVKELLSEVDRAAP